MFDLQTWHIPNRVDDVKPRPVMDVVVQKLKNSTQQSKENPYKTLDICQVSFAAAQIVFAFLTWPPYPQSSSVLPLAFPQWTFQGNQRKSNPDRLKLGCILFHTVSQSQGQLGFDNTFPVPITKKV